MPAGKGPRRLVPIRAKGQESVRVRWLTARVAFNSGGGSSVIWAGCDKPTPPTMFTVENPGSSFARVVPVTPTYGASGINFSFPCE